MNYMQIYKALMEKAKTEARTKGLGTYYESHHIIPDFMFKNRKRKGPRGHLEGNPDDAKNLVLLTPREHILAHVLLAKALKGQRYWAQASSALVFFYTKVIGSHKRQNVGLAGLMRKYARYREMGIAGISTARKGKFPAVDAVTRESVGSVSRDHPKVLSGEWVHHSKGRKVTSDVELSRRKAASTGLQNSNAREVDTEYIKQKLLEFDHIVKTQYDNNFIKRRFVEWFDSQDHPVVFYRFRHTNKPLTQSISGMSAKFLDLAKLAEDLQPVTSWNIPKYGMGPKYDCRDKHFSWYTNGTYNIQVRSGTSIPEGYTKGRTL